MHDFITSNNNTIPARVMERVKQRLANDEDWQLVATEELRRYIPEGEDDLSELNEVLSACEQE